MLLLAETLTRFAKKHPKLICKPGLRESRSGWEQTSRCHRRNWTCINFSIFILSFSGMMFGHACEYKRHKRFCSEKEKKKSIAQMPRVQIGNTPQCLWAFHPQLYKWCISPARWTPDILHLFLFCIPTRWGCKKILNSPHAIPHWLKWTVWQGSSHLCEDTVGHWKEQYTKVQPSASHWGTLSSTRNHQFSLAYFSFFLIKISLPILHSFLFSFNSCLRVQHGTR